MVFYTDRVYQGAVLDEWAEEGWGRLGKFVGFMVVLITGFCIGSCMEERMHSICAQRTNPVVVESYDTNIEGEHNRAIERAEIEKLVE